MTDETHDINVDIDAALTRLFADARTQADRAAPTDQLLEHVADVDVTTGEVDDLDDSLVAVRSASAVADRQLLVHGAWADVVLDVARSEDDRVDVRGTVVGPDEPCSVQLLDGVDEMALGVTDALGEFALLGVVPGRYELVVAARRAELSAVVDIS